MKVRTVLGISVSVLGAFHSLQAAQDLSYITRNITATSGSYKAHNQALLDTFVAQRGQLLQQQVQQKIDIKKKRGFIAASMTTLHVQEKNKMLATAEQQLDAHDYALLQKMSDKQQSIFERFSQEWSMITSYWQKNTVEFLQRQFNQANPFNNKSAVVMRNDVLDAQEQSFIKNRNALVQSGLQKFLGKQQQNAITIGYCAPGGGYRAMMLTSGYLKALEDLGLLDATTYISALSGSTWLLLPWIFSGKTIQQFQYTLLDKIKAGQLNPTKHVFDRAGYLSLDYLSFLVKILWKKYLFGQQISSVDVYGSLLQYTLCDNKKTYLFTDQWDVVKDGSKPFPVYTSVSIDENDRGREYYWNEFTPLEVRNLDLKCVIPAYSFGSKFDEGKSKSIEPQQALGYFMGTFGSAYLVNLLDIEKIIAALKADAKKHGPQEEVQYMLASMALALLNDIPASFGRMRAFPSLTHNPFLNVSYAIPSVFKQAKNLMYFDGGLSYNIPAMPLLRQERKVHTIIIGDTSGNNPTQTEDPEELQKFFKDAQQKFGYRYTRVDDKSTSTLRLYKDTEHKQAPRLIYINFVRDDALLQRSASDTTLQTLINEANLKGFDFSCVLSGYCNMLNFQYTEAEFKQLSGIAEFNIKANKEIIRRFINE